MLTMLQGESATQSNATVIPWHALCATVGVGQLTEGWTLDEEREEDAEPRLFSHKVSFSQPFKAVPVVHLGLTGYDVEEHGTARLSLKAEDITAQGFRAIITTWRDTRVYAVEFNWLAVGA